jgi:hypothetical protein
MTRLDDDALPVYALPCNDHNFHSENRLKMRGGGWLLEDQQLKSSWRSTVLFRLLQLSFKESFDFRDLWSREKVMIFYPVMLHHHRWAGQNVTWKDFRVHDECCRV